MEHMPELTWCPRERRHGLLDQGQGLTDRRGPRMSRGGAMGRVLGREGEPWQDVSNERQAAHGTAGPKPTEGWGLRVQEGHGHAPVDRARADGRA